MRKLLEFIVWFILFLGMYHLFYGDSPLSLLFR